MDNASTDGTAAAITAELPEVRLISNRTDKGPAAANQALEQCTGRQIVRLNEDAYPDDPATVLSLLAPMDSDPKIGAVSGRLILPDGNAYAGPLPTLATPGATCYRKPVLDRLGGFSDLVGTAADYDLALRIVNGGFRIEQHDDIIFHGRPDFARDPADFAELRAAIRDRLTVAGKLLPGQMGRIYSHDWWMREMALAHRAGQSRAAWGGFLSACARRISHIFTAPDPVSRESVEEVFEYRRHNTMVGDWARRNSVWRVVLADFSENIWATFNACRSTGLQMRCISDNTPAFEKLTYRDLPIVPASRAFEGGGIDGVIITTSDPAKIEPTFKLLRNHFHGPILRLSQAVKTATRAQATAA